MNNTKQGILAAVLLFLCLAAFAIVNPVSAGIIETVKIYINGVELRSDVEPIIINNRTMVPLRAVSEGLGMEVEWDAENRHVLIKDEAVVPAFGGQDSAIINGSDLSLMGEAVATAVQLRQLLKENNPEAPDLAELYLQIGKKYGVRGDIAFCQAAKETGWWKFGGIVQPWQNNYCGLGATGRPATGNEELNGADPQRVSYRATVHGAIFDSTVSGVEAHIQHLYAYACNKSLPNGTKILDPRFTLVSRGIAESWSDLDGRWAVPGNGYGQSILSDYYAKALVLDGGSNSAISVEDKIKRLEKENKRLKDENQELRIEIDKK